MNPPTCFGGWSSRRVVFVPGQSSFASCHARIENDVIGEIGILDLPLGSFDFCSPWFVCKLITGPRNWFSCLQGPPAQDYSTQHTRSVVSWSFPNLALQFLNPTGVPRPCTKVHELAFERKPLGWNSGQIHRFRLRTRPALAGWSAGRPRCNAPPRANA